MLSVHSFSQNNSIMKNQDIVKLFLMGFDESSEIQQSFALLADDYKFKNPMVALNSKTEFIELAKQIGAVVHSINIINIAESGDWVAVHYDFKTSIPGLESNLATEWFLIEDGMIKASHLIYDTAEWRKFYAQMKP